MERTNKEFDMGDLQASVKKQVIEVFKTVKPVPDLEERKIGYTIECTFDLTKKAFTVLKEKRVEYSGFGTFKLRVKKGRKRINPATQEIEKDKDGNELKTPDTYTIKFKPAPDFLKALQNSIGLP